MAETNEASVKFQRGKMRADGEGFDALVDLSFQTEHFRSARISMDFSNVVWMDAHLAPSLLALVRQMERRTNTVRLVGLRPDVSLILSKNGFLKRRAHDTNATTMPVSEFTLDQGIEFAQYAKRHLSRREMPKMTSSLQRKFFEAIDELFANCSLHSRSAIKVSVGGQFYPRKGRLCFSIVDGGHGVMGSRKLAGEPLLSAERAIDWAMQYGNTTRQLDIPGGLGLNVLREFIELNGGRLIVVSNNGYWCQAGASVRKRRLPNAFPGTSVIIEIDTNDRQQYDLSAAEAGDVMW